MSIEPNNAPEPRTPAAVAAPPSTGEPSLAALVGGIVGDVQNLVKHHLDLFHHEIQEDFRKTKEAALSVALAASLAALGGILLVVMLIGLLAWAVPDVPWWGWCGILAGALLLTAGALYYRGKKKFESFNPLPDESAQAVKESVEWIQDRMTPGPK